MTTKVLEKIGLVPQWLQEFEKEREDNKPLLIYISAPYTLGDTVSNVRFACEIADKILEKGHIPHIPHLTHFYHYISPKPWEVWMRICGAMVSRCDAVLRMDGESRGADIEVQIAKRLGIPVYYSLDEIKEIAE